MEPTDPADPQGVSIGGIDAQPEQVQHSVRRGQPTTLEVYLQFVESTPQADRYRSLKDYQEYAGEASVGNLMGGKPHLREHPRDYWPVDSHVVPIVFGSEVHELSDFWALIQGVDDSNTVIVAEPPPVTDGYGQNYGANYGGLANPSQNQYRLSVDVVPLADIAEYPDRQSLLDDLSPTL